MTLRRILMLLSLLCAAIAVGIADDGAGETERNLPEEPPPPEKEKECPCDDEPKNRCVYTKISLGATSGEHEKFNVNALVYAHEPSPALYTPRVLYVETPYYFRHLSNGRHQDGVTPSGYTFGRQGDEKVVFEFAEGESVAKARPGENSNVSATLKLLDANGTSTSADPYFADLETSNGEVWRFAVKTTEKNAARLRAPTAPTSEPQSSIAISIAAPKSLSSGDRQRVITRYPMAPPGFARFTALAARATPGAPPTA